MSIYWPIGALTVLTISVCVWARWPRRRRIPSDTLRAMARAAQRERGDALGQDVREEIVQVPGDVIERTRKRMGLS